MLGVWGCGAGLGLFPLVVWVVGMGVRVLGALSAPLCVACAGGAVLLWGGRSSGMRWPGSMLDSGRGAIVAGRGVVRQAVASDVGLN